MFTFSRHAQRRAFLLGSGLLAISAPARAAETAPAPQAAPDAELVVSGRRDKAQAEVQKTPASITLLSGDKLSQQGITTVRDLGNIVPNLFQQRTAVSYANTTFFLRGIGELDAQGEPSVPVYVDGIYTPKSLGSQSELLDIERVEVARGPQGQSFGHSAEGGTIRISTSVPDATPRLKAQAGYGTYNDARFGFAASGPLGGDFYGGLAANYHRRDGFSHNVTTGGDVNNVDYFTARGKLRYAPGEKLDVLLTLSGIRDRSTVRGVQNTLFGDREAHNQVYPYNKFDQLAASLDVNYRFSEHLKLESLTSAYGFYQRAFYDNTGDYYSRTSQLVTYQDRAYQEELKLTGTYDLADFTAGLYYFREEWYTNRRANIAANATNVPSAILYRPVYATIQQNTDNLAFYGQSAFHLSSALTLTLGIRYNWERHTQNNNLFNLASVNSNAANYLQVIYSDPASLIWSTGKLGQSWDTWAPRVAVDYRFSPHVLGYALRSEGTKSAGYDFRAQSAGTAGLLQASTPFAPERAINYEGGFKTEWLGGRLRANISGFYIDFRNIQITAFDPVTTISRRFNAGRGSSHGVEFESTALPFDGLQLDFNVSYLNARLDTFTGNVTSTSYAANPANPWYPGGFTLRTSAFSGARLPNSPVWQGRFAATWQVPLRIPGKLTANADANFQSASYNAITNNFSDRVPSQLFVNGQLTYTTRNDHWAYALSVRNLTNRQYAQGIGYVAATNGLPLYRAANYNDPRTILFTLTYRR